ncbi:hypothetical protein, partial [Rhizobium sp. GR12]|uniref:hypothetical protein n=1 Tax=Rhizobium sp. GR12 TaxID=3053925 RepID=UPI002FBE292A
TTARNNKRPPPDAVQLGADLNRTVVGLSQRSNHVELNQSVADPRDKPEDDVRVFCKVRIHLVTPRGVGGIPAKGLE